MCNPAVIPVVMAIAGAGVTAYGQHQQSKSQERIEKFNADQAHEDELAAIRRGGIEEEQHRAEVRQMLGAQRAAFGANNVVAADGSPLGLLAETAKFGELDALTIRNNAARQAFGYDVERRSSRARSRAYRRNSTTEAGGTLLAGGAQAYGLWKGG